MFVYVIPVATLVMTYVLWWIPRQEQHAQTDLTNLIEHQFDQKIAITSSMSYGLMWRR